MAITPFTIDIPDEDLADLKRRLEETRWPDEIPGSGWDYGSNLAYVKELCGYWRDVYDWRAHERMLNEFPQFKADVDGLDIHFIHVKGKGPNPMPLVITHGWPSSFFEMHKVIGPLSDPASHGGDPADAFDVVAPSLPGYGFSDHARERGMDTKAIAALWVKLMEQLGYERFGSQGGDWGAGVTTALGVNHPERMIGVHLNMVTAQIDEEKLTPEQRAWWEDLKAYRQEEWGYVHLQGTKPQTVSYGLNDSPSGLAAWIVEKWRRWSDCGGDVERSYTKDELLTNISVYWFTQSISSSMRLYKETFRGSTTPRPSPRIEVPTGVATFKEANRPPRVLAEHAYNLKRWTDMEQGGHFPAMENPGGLVHEVREFFRPLR